MTDAVVRNRLERYVALLGDDDVLELQRIVSRRASGIYDERRRLELEQRRSRRPDRWPGSSSSNAAGGSSAGPPADAL